MSADTVSYLDWQPTLDPGVIYSQPAAPQYPVYYREQLYFLEQRASEGGRSVIVRQLDDGRLETLTPENFNVRSRVHEYGGKAFLIEADYLWFSNDADRRIYRQGLNNSAEPEAISRPDADDMAIDFQLTPDHEYLIFVSESPRENTENVNCLSVIGFSGRNRGKKDILVSGADFYANPVISPAGDTLCWIEWNHPQMPWDGTRLMTGRLESRGGRLSVIPDSVTQLAGGDECAVCQLQYSGSGKLFFCLDGKDPVGGWQADCWDLFSWDGQSVRRITSDAGEYGEGHWVFGQCRYVVTDEDHIIAVRTLNGQDDLVEIDISSGNARTVTETSASSFSQLFLAANKEVFYTAASFWRTPSIQSYSTSSRTTRDWYRTPSVLDDRDISEPVQLTYPTRDGKQAHAWYYRPVNHRYRAPAGELPPLLVMVHGGPTSRCDSALNLLRQFWTGRGFAVLDVNHRGSTGYCRQYRQSLRNQWGVVDSADVADAVIHATREKMADPRMVCIRGGSAGGYVVLRALTVFPDLFCAGASYYGIGNLVTLMEFTHKFEARYLDGLLGEAYHGRLSDQPGSPYYDRSPIHQITRLKSPMIIFQGLDDKVVPPRLAHELVDILEQRGVMHQYVEYAGEGHGFRNQDTRVDSLQKEASFFARAISEQLKSSR